MRFNLLALALSLGPVSIEACVTDHVYCIFSGDILSAQVFDNDDEVCSGSKTINFASSDTEFCFDSCRPGYSFCVKGNGQTATHKNGDVYAATMTAAKRQSNTFDCGSTGKEDVNIKGSEHESCFSDFFGNGNQHHVPATCATIRLLVSPLLLASLSSIPPSPSTGSCV